MNDNLLFGIFEPYARSRLIRFYWPITQCRNIIKDFETDVNGDMMNTCLLAYALKFQIGYRWDTYENMKVHNHCDNVANHPDFYCRRYNYFHR